MPIARQGQPMKLAGGSLRTFAASGLIELAWALRWLCKPCAQRLLAAARRLAPEAERFLTRRF